MRMSGWWTEPKRRVVEGGSELPVGRSAAILSAAFTVLVVTVVAALGIGANAAEGDEINGAPESVAPTAAQTKELLESGTAESLVEEPGTDLHAAQTMPHRDIGRNEALELVEAVFEPELEQAGGIYDEIEPERYLSNNTAVIDPASMPEGLAGPEGEDLATERPNAGVLVESTLPLRTENASGDTEALDLELQHSEGELQPKNPLSEVGLPIEMGEGISLPGPEVEITVADSPEGRVATNVEGQFAFYPEIAEATDLIASPAPRGLEMMTDVRSAEAPRQTTYDLTLPTGAELRSTGEGGAEVLESGHVVVVVPPPTALDAAGNPVKTELSVSGDEMTVTTTPDLSTAYPVLVDPTWETPESWSWAWNHDTEAQWIPSTTNSAAMNAWGATRAGTYGLDLTSGLGGNGHWGDNTNWDWVVPRYLHDLETGAREAPSTWIYSLSAEGIFFTSYGNYANYPALVLGLVDPEVGWATSGVHYGGQGELNTWTNHWSFPNPSEMTAVKSADMNLVTYEEEDPSKVRDTYVSSATVVYVDDDAPLALKLNPPAHWVGTVAAPASYEFEDKGLGMKYAEVTYNGSVLTQVSLPCDGRPLNPCPRLLSQAQQPLTFSTASLPTGRDWVTVGAGDPVFAQGVPGHSASGPMLVEVDHTAPEVSLSGSLAEQGSLGTRLPTYALRVNAKDGTPGAPQSGIKKVEVKVDGATVPMAEQAEWEPNCQTEDCSVGAEWTLNSSAYAAGPHEVQVIATDAVGNATTKNLQIELRHPAPTLSVSGSLTQQATLGGELPSYKLQIAAAAQTESPPAAGLPAYSSSFGTLGTGNGQFAHPGDVAVGNEGNLFVVDTNNNRIEKFSAAGVFSAELGPKQIPAECQLSRPTAIAITAAGNLVVADSAHKRVVELSPTGACLLKFGAAGTGPGQFAGSGPEGIAIDYHGNIWVSDTYGGRLEKFGEGGKFIRSVGTKGTAYEQLGLPTAVEAAPGGQIYVTDWEDDKVAEYGEGGAFIRQFGSQGNEPGQLQQPTGIAIDSRGDVWVGDQNNDRVEEFNQAGEYLRRFGTEGPNAGQFRLQYPIGIATDTTGDIWVTDPLNNRVEKWISAGFARPAGTSYVRAIGSSGGGSGQFSWPVDVAVAANGNLWVTDFFNNRIEKLSESGGYLGQITGEGTAKLTNPIATAIDPAGHLWVLDRGNNRVEEFTESGGLIRAFGGSGTSVLNGPSGIAVDSKGHVWVADSTNNRLEEFSETGTLIRTVGAKGSTTGTFLEPQGIAATPEGNIWTADSGNNRLEEFSETGVFLKSIGSAGAGAGRFSLPTDVKLDPAGHLWVVEEGNHRVQELTANGEFLGEFGSSGTSPGQFQNPLSLAFAHNGNILVADYVANHLSEWQRPTAHSQISTEITVDGRRVDAGEAACVVETCPLSREWTLGSAGFTPGSHVVVIRATDGLGNTTTKVLNVHIGDTTKPGLEVGGELVSAPEGWVQQEDGNYGFHASATDAGYGVTSLTFSLDGKVVTQKTQSCAAGSCSASISMPVNARELAAGSHHAEVIATDGAGNVAVRKWTVNVDPEGHVSTQEATATVEAAEETAGATESPLTSELENAPQLGTPQSGEIPVTGGNVPMSIGQDVTEGVEMEVADQLVLSSGCSEGAGSDSSGGEASERELEEGHVSGGSVCSPEEEAANERQVEEEAKAEEEQVVLGHKVLGLEPITIVPKNVSVTSGEMSSVDGNATLAADTQEDVDTVFRPMANGGYNFADIRSQAAPEHYAYELELSPKLELVQVSPSEVAIRYTDGGPVSFSITALPAHDAIGTAVPTHIAVTGSDVVTLTVEHRGTSPAGGGFVYPVVGGTGWEGGFRSISFEMNEPPPPSEAPIEGSLGQQGAEVRVEVEAVGPLTSAGGDDPESHFVFSLCNEQFINAEEAAEIIEKAAEASSVRGEIVGNCAKEDHGSHLIFGLAVKGTIHVIPNEWVWVNEKQQFECTQWGPLRGATVNCYVSPPKARQAITVGGNFRLPNGTEIDGESPCITIYGHLLSHSPYREREEQIWTEAGAGQWFEKCHWPSQ
jgi:tripartite motif-containing protein 71